MCRRKGKGLDEPAAARVLSVLAALWRRLPASSCTSANAATAKPPAGEPTAAGPAGDADAAAGAPPRAVLLSYVATLSPLAGSLQSREARLGLAAALGSLAAGPLPELRRAAELLAGLTAMSATAVGVCQTVAAVMAAGCAHEPQASGALAGIAESHSLPHMCTHLHATRSRNAIRETFSLYIVSNMFCRWRSYRGGQVEAANCDAASAEPALRVADRYQGNVHNICLCAYRWRRRTTMLA